MAFHRDGRIEEVKPDQMKWLPDANIALKHLAHYEATKSADPEKPTSSYTDEELHVMIRALARYRHGLPGG